ncbi:hypothetical protein RB1573 [Rhodopirellula baltica SH 1]|uniref:Uncharacterized protein n=1 Tax=Rhodopirellula baltica (strain DSM 10527 / NCIMB 13988 / SH1) TaxID=243090 RepID=Q7UX45_RHOBA|nr:hypothetical protein RB1573 [Rhodopirellula baltica SH 1]
MVRPTSFPKPLNQSRPDRNKVEFRQIGCSATHSLQR